MVFFYFLITMNIHVDPTRGIRVRVDFFCFQSWNFWAGFIFNFSPILIFFRPV